MDHLGILIPVTAVAVGPIAWIATTWIRAKHGYPLEDEKGNPVSRTDTDAKRTIELLTNENERQAGQITRLEERIAVLERIATDPAERVAREIDALR
jgi:hypothetical protein